MYGHIVKMAEAEKKGIEAAGGKVDLFQYVVVLHHGWLPRTNLTAL
jgi:NAD(P)H dehydrogenase (quinone)